MAFHIIRRRPLFAEVDGLLLPRILSPPLFRTTLRYVPRFDDVFVVTYPKCGTTWTQHLLSSLFLRGRCPLDFRNYFLTYPFMDLLGADILTTIPRPVAIKTHLPFHLIPFSPRARYIYVARNPKDCCVSLFNHARLFPYYDFCDGVFDDFFELFIRGQIHWNDYFEHLHGWYCHRDDPNVLFLTYEDMKRDTRSAVVQMADFLGEEYVRALDYDPYALDNIVHYSSYKYLKENYADPFSVFQNETSYHEYLSNSFLPEGVKHMVSYMHRSSHHTNPWRFFCKGLVGDWRNYISVHQSQRIDDRFRSICYDSDMTQMWCDEMEL